MLLFLSGQVTVTGCNVSMLRMTPQWLRRILLFLLDTGWNTSSRFVLLVVVLLLRLFLCGNFTNKVFHHQMSSGVRLPVPELFGKTRSPKIHVPCARDLHWELAHLARDAKRTIKQAPQREWQITWNLEGVWGSASLVTSECSRLWRRDLAHQVHGWNKSGVAHRRAWLRAMYAAWESGILLENVLQKVFRTCSVLYILTWKCASRHSGVQFFHNIPQRNFKKWSETVSFLRFWLENVLLAIAACNFSTSQLQKVVRPWGVLYSLTWKCASRHSGVQFFHIWTSKSGPRPSVFYDLDLKMCFSLQRRAIFPHRYFQKWSEHARNVCSLREWHFTWKCASKSVPNMQCFVHFDLKMCFSPQRRAIFPQRNFKKWS